VSIQKSNIVRGLFRDPARAFDLDHEPDPRNIIPLQTGGGSDAGAAQRKQHKAIIDMASLQLNQAAVAVQSIGQAVAAFEATLDPEKEVQLVIIQGAAVASVFVDRMLPLGADRIQYEGRDQDDCPVMVLQHVSQMNVTLKAVNVEQAVGHRLSYRIVTDLDLANNDDDNDDTEA
jgi:hypothetical protein